MAAKDARRKNPLKEVAKGTAKGMVVNMLLFSANGSAMLPLHEQVNVFDRGRPPASTGSLGPIWRTPEQVAPDSKLFAPMKPVPQRTPHVINSMIGPIDVEGWELVGSEAEVKKYIGDRTLGIRIDIISKDQQAATTAILPSGVPPLPVAAPLTANPPRTAPRPEHGRWRAILPSFGKNTLAIRAYQLSDGKVTKEERHPVELPNSALCPDPSLLVATEMALPSEVRDGICDVNKVFRPFRKGPLKLIADYRTPKDPGFLFDEVFTQGSGEETEAIRLSIPKERSFAGYQLDELVQTHEQTHDLYGAKGTEQDFLKEAWTSARKAMRYRVPTALESGNGYDVPANEPVWRPLTEGYHLEHRLGLVSHSISGHPWDNPNEMFASTVATMRVFPDELINEYRCLDWKSRSAVGQAIRASVQTLQTINPDPAALRGLLPKVDQVLSATAAAPKPVDRTGRQRGQDHDLCIRSQAPTLRGQLPPG